MQNNYYKNIASTVILAVLLLLSFLLMKPILISILTGVLLAFLFSPLYKRLNKALKSRNLSTTIIILILVGLIIIPLWFLIPLLVDQSVKIYISSQQINFVALLQSIFPSLAGADAFSTEIGSVVYSFVTNITNSVMNTFSKLILNFAKIFLHLLVALFTFFFTLRDGDKFLSYIQSILPFNKDVEKKLFKSSKDITYSVLYGQVVLGVVQGIFVGIGFFIFGVPNALFLTLLACLAGIFPIIGTTIIWLPVAIVMLIGGGVGPFFGILVFGIISMIIENFLKPIFVSKRTNLNSAIILLGMVGGILFFGILGIILGPLILAYLLIVLEIYRDKRIPGV